MSFSLPTNCPSCGSTLIWKGVDLACDNRNCHTKKVMALESFLIKTGVEGVTATSLENWGITGFRSMLHFKGSDGKAQASFIHQLNTKVFSKTQEELFACMYFDGAGETTINKLFSAFGSLGDTSRKLYVEKTTDLPEGIGQKTIEKIKEDWKANIYILKHIMEDSRWKPVVKAVAPSTGKLVGKSFLITGTLSEGRKAFEKLIVDNGGTLASSVSKTLSYLLVGTDAGSKLDKAKKLGVTILNEDKFRSMI